MGKSIEIEMTVKVKVKLPVSGASAGELALAIGPVRNEIGRELVRLTVESVQEAIVERSSLPRRAARHGPWTVTLTGSADGMRLDFRTQVDWDTHSKRLRVTVPVASQDDTASREVPFGFVDRRYEPEKLDCSQWNANTMDFPALHWVRKAVDESSGVALLNRGLPCYRWMPGSLDLSLLRSPEAPFCALEARHHGFWDIDGQRDTGRHDFAYSLMPYYDGLSSGDLTRIGYEYNLPAPVKPPFSVEGDVVVTAWKPAEDGSGWILRAQEAGGQGTELALSFREERSVTETDLLERPKAEPVRQERFSVPLRRHGIATLLVR